jgi:iron(III) transport system permease protein
MPGAASNVRLLLATLLFAIIVYLLVYPVLSLVLTSFQVNVFGQDLVYGLGNWRDVLSQGRVGEAVWNTISLSAARQFLALILGVPVAWLIARTNLPGRRLIEVGFWIALFMPTLPVTLAWVFLMGGRSSLLNQWLGELPFVEGPLFNIYSWWGIVWVHLMTASLAIKVFLLVPAFRSMDSALEEVARTCGATISNVLLRVLVPIMMPTILVVLLLGMIRSMQAFEVELILGAPARIDVYSTVIYRAMGQEPPLHGLASALSITFLATLAPFVALQQWYGGAHAHASISGRFSNRLFDLDRWRWPLFCLVMLLVSLMTIVPFVCLFVGTFMKLFGLFNLPAPWTTEHWVNAFALSDIPRALWNTIRLGLFSAATGAAIYTAIAYVAVKGHFFAARVLDFLTWLPALIPGLVLSLGLLQMFAGSAVLRPFYGSIAVLILAVVIASMTVGTQIIKNGMQKLGGELEEAAAMSGATRFYTFRRVVMPLIAPSLAVIALEVFAAASSAVGIIALLGTGSTQPLSILQLMLLDSGKFESGAVVGIVIMILTVGAALLARHIATRAGLRR